ncbi:unknown [Clostridium sp. CAG:307]|nr:unknown [Clostridium sp. CAG:307]
MILTYDEGFKRASNPEWFKSFFKRDEIATDEEVKKINELALEVGLSYLKEYLEEDRDVILQREYVADLISYLEEVKCGTNGRNFEGDSKTKK